MPSLLTYYVGNRNPSITETITSNGVIVDLTGKTVRFKMRAVGSSTLKVDQPINNVPDATGVVRYDELPTAHGLTEDRFDGGTQELEAVESR